MSGKTKRVEVVIENGFKTADGDHAMGDIFWCTPSQCKMYCQAGWAKDLSGEEETLPVDTNRIVVLEPENSVQQATAEEVK